MMKKQIAVIGSLLVAVGLLASCGSNAQETKESDTLQIVTTFYPIYEFTKEVVGETGEVELLIPAGTEPHDYEPSGKDLAKITDADVFVYNSQEFETWVVDVANSLDQTQTLVIEAAEPIELIEGEEEGQEDHDHDHELDPHVWLDPVLAMEEVKATQTKLSEKYPEKAEIFEANANAYLGTLVGLDETYQAALANATQRTFVTQHAAFGYLAHRYNLTQEAIAGLSPDEEPSAARLAELKEYVTEHDINVIYFEENASSKVAETLSKEAGVALAVLNPLEGLTTEQQAAGENYVTVMTENLEALKETIK